MIVIINLYITYFIIFLPILWLWLYIHAVPNLQCANVSAFNPHICRLISNMIVDI